MIDLYSLATPNGQKIGIALEELGAPYTAHLINIGKGEQNTPEFKKINPNSKIPAIVDQNGPDGKPISIFESGAILIYLAEKFGKLLSAEPRQRSETLQWLFFQVGGVGPMFGQFGHFTKMAVDKCDHPYPAKRYTEETKRLLAVMEKQLSTHEYLAGSEYSIADIATFPWVDALDHFYKAAETLGLAEYTATNRWLKKCLARPAVQKGMLVCKPN